MSQPHIFIGDHPETLGSGRRVTRGDDLRPGDVDPTNPVDQALIAEGVLIAPTGPDLSKLSRDELDARAIALGVENPEQLPNKSAVITAIQDKENTQ